MDKDRDALFSAAIAGDAHAITQLGIQADIVDGNGRTILNEEASRGNTENVQFILKEFSNKNLLQYWLCFCNESALHSAILGGYPEVVEVLIASAKHSPYFQDILRHPDTNMDTPLHLAVRVDHLGIVNQLVKADPSYPHDIRNKEGETPIYIAVKKGYIDIVKIMCTTCTALCFDGPHGTTALHAAFGPSGMATDLIKAAKQSWRNSKDEPNHGFEVLFIRTNSSDKTVLEMAVEGNYLNLVELILVDYLTYQHGCGSKSKSGCLQRSIYLAANKGYNDILKVLCETHEADISPDNKGLIPVIVVAIKERDKESVFQMLGAAKHLVTCADHEGWTPLHFAAYHEFDSILDAIVEALHDVGFNFVYKEATSTPLHVAAERGHTSTLIKLMESWPVPTIYVAVNMKCQNILHLAAAQRKKEMIHGILENCPENYKDMIVNKQDIDGNTPLHLLISNGCFIPQLIKYKGLDLMAKNKRNWFPRDMLYLDDEIIAEQVEIKIALDQIQTTKYCMFRRKSVEKKLDISESIVLPSKRHKKDVLFEDAKKLLRDKKHTRMKQELERYKKRTNTQIIVTALITTVTFTVGFTMPGGLHQSGEVDQGLVVLSKKTAFNAFMVSDALALLLSTSSLFLYFLESMYEDPHKVSKINAASTGLNIVSVMAMMLTFITGTYVVLSHTPALAITVCLIGSFFFLFVIVLLIQMIYYRQVKRNEE